MLDLQKAFKKAKKVNPFKERELFSVFAICWVIYYFGSFGINAEEPVQS